MRTLLLILLLPLMGYCQTINGGGGKSVEVDLITYRLSILMKEYKAKCHADSSYEYMPADYSGYSSFDPKTGTGVANSIYIAPSKEWVHKEPTFEGFMDFVINYYK